MAIIVAGKLYIKPGMREEFVKNSCSAINNARANDFCEDFSVSPAPIEQDRVNIFEKWKSRSALKEFRGAAPEDDTFALVVRSCERSEPRSEPFVGRARVQKVDVL